MEDKVVFVKSVFEKIASKDVHVEEAVRLLGVPYNTMYRWFREWLHVRESPEAENVLKTFTYTVYGYTCVGGVCKCNLCGREFLGVKSVKTHILASHVPEIRSGASSVPDTLDMKTLLEKILAGEVSLSILANMIGTKKATARKWVLRYLYAGEEDKNKVVEYLTLARDLKQTKPKKSIYLCPVCGAFVSFSKAGLLIHIARIHYGVES